MICRPIITDQVSTFDHPVSQRNTEIEPLTVFEDVFGLWERVFLCGGLGVPVRERDPRPQRAVYSKAGKFHFASEFHEVVALLQDVAMRFSVTKNSFRRRSP